MNASYYASLRAFRTAFNEQVLRPMLIAAFERLYEQGTLPLPDLSWGPRAIWYRGDLV